MKTVIACNEPSVALKIRTCLQQLGIECSLSQVLSLESAHIFVTTEVDCPRLLLFFGSQQFSTDELALLRQLWESGGDHLKVVAVGSNLSPGEVLQAVRSGAIDCLDIHVDFANELRNVVDRVRNSFRERTRLGRLFTVMGAVGGAGTSLLAINLAAALAQREQVCGLLDLQLRGGDLATLLKSSPRHTLLSLVSKADQLDRIMFEQSLIKHDCGVHLLASPEPFSDYRQISSPLVQKAVELARSMYPSVVVDLEDCEHSEQVRTLAASDRIIIPMRLDFVSLYRTKLCVDYLIRASVEREHITIVANRTGQHNELPLERLEEVLKLPVLHQIPDDPGAVNVSVNLGVPLVIASPRTRIAMAIVHLAESLLGVQTKEVAPGWGARGLMALKPVASLFNLLQV